MDPRRSYMGLLAAVSIGAASLHACVPALQDYPTWDGGGAASTGSGGSGGEDFFFDAGMTGPPPADAGGLCGNDIHQIVTDPPNVYFVLDASGSMGELVSGGTRYSVVQSAAGKIVKKLKLLIKAGAATFPGDESCAAGHEVFAPAFDQATQFQSAIQNVAPSGGTPTAATLKALLPKLTALPGKTVVVLATDGGPNCNAAASCDVSGCMPNIEGCSDKCCQQNTNCCAPNGPGGPEMCVDHDPAVAAVAALAAAGIRVFVIGIPGSQTYGKVLSDMALAGGAALTTYPFYYKVDDLGTLSAILSAAAGSAIPCEFTLDAAPEVPDYTNVYFDQDVVKQDAANGWTWASPTTITLHGAACNQLHSGDVGQVQIVSGCPTEATK